MDFDSPDEKPEVAAAQPAAPEPTAAPAVAPEASTSPANPETPAEPKTALDVVLSALRKPEDGKATAAEPAGAVESPESPSAAIEEPQDESLADVPKLPDETFRALPKEARTAFNQLRKQVNDLRPAAERGKAVGEYLQSAGMTSEEFAELQQVGALLKHDPAKAREVLLEHLDRLNDYLGLKMPDDIASDVEQGFVSEERGREISELRAKTRAAEAALAAREADAATRSVVGAVEAWETQTRGTDPDFDHKLPNIRQAVELEAVKRMSAGKPVLNPQDALQIVRKAYDEANAMVARFRPKPAPVPVSPSSAALVPAAPVREPTTPMEAVMRGLRMSARG